MHRICTRSTLAAALLAALAATGCATRGPAEAPTIAETRAPGIFLDLDGRATLPAGRTLRPLPAKGLAVTKAGEGWRAKLYNDVAGYCTIGHGHLIKLKRCDGTEPAEFLDGLTETEGEALLVKDMAKAQTAVMLAVTAEITDTQYAALCDFVFNVGAGNFRKSRLLEVVNDGQHDQVATQLMRWVKAGGKEIPGLRNRREHEIALYYDGMLRPRASAPAGEDISSIDIVTGE
jgi:lysozyme